MSDHHDYGPSPHAVKLYNILKEFKDGKSTAKLAKENKVTRMQIENLIRNWMTMKILSFG